ncbi:hypothetical protein [Ignisphaera cupida]|uniref:hypothetical protein n=1 Tax=Ignisphaera cupida TaxID=3050454 RepID=UPI003F68BF99
MSEGGVLSIVNELYKAFINDVLPKLEKIADEGKRYLYFLAWLNSELEKRCLGKIIVTGGFAVEVYTGRIYRTMDVDIIVENAKAKNIIDEFLNMFSEKIGRGHLPKYEILQLKSIDIVSTVYNKPVIPTKIIVNSFTLYLEPVEELIVTYLAGWKFWGATEDRDKAIWLYMVWKDKLNMHYLESRALKENVYDYLQELKKIAI